MVVQNAVKRNAAGQPCNIHCLMPDEFWTEPSNFKTRVVLPGFTGTYLSQCSNIDCNV